MSESPPGTPPNLPSIPRSLLVFVVSVRVGRRGKSIGRISRYGTLVLVWFRVNYSAGRKKMTLRDSNLPPCSHPYHRAPERQQAILHNGHRSFFFFFFGERVVTALGLSAMMMPIVSAHPLFCYIGRFPYPG